MTSRLQSTPATTPPLLDIVIVTASGCHAFIAACLDSLRVHPLSSGAQRVVVVDNDSRDGTEAIVGRYEEVTLLAMGRNAGFSAANNTVLRTSTARYVLLLNPDTEVGPGVLDACVKRLEEDADIAIVGCRLVDAAGVPDPNAKRTLPTPGAALRRLSFADRVLGASAYHTPDMGFEDNGPVEAVSGAFMMIRRSLVESIGVLDERYWMYGEDLDLCARARAAGRGVWYEGAVTTLHVKGGSAGRVRSLRPNIAFHQAMGRFYRRYHSGRKPLVDLVVYVAIAGRLAIAVVLSGVIRFRDRRREAAGRVVS